MKTKYSVLVYTDDEMHIACETDEQEEADLVFDNVATMIKEYNSTKTTIEQVFHTPIFDCTLRKKVYPNE